MTEPQWRRFASTAAWRQGSPSGDYGQLWQWSVDNPARFWRAVWEYFDVPSQGTRPGEGDAGILADASMPGAQWFPGVELNYVDLVLRHRHQAGAAIVGIDEQDTRTEIGWHELPGRIGAVAAELRRIGVTEGDTVAAYLPDVADAMVAFLAAASLGAIWSSCGQDYAPEGAASRLSQLNPKVLFSADGYQLNGRWIDKRPHTAELRGLLGEPALIVIGGDAYRELVASPAEPKVEAVPFDHPLWVLFSSGTTGRPKGIVHGHGGIMLEHLKTIALHADLGPDDVFFWQTALSWMMWSPAYVGVIATWFASAAVLETAPEATLLPANLRATSHPPEASWAPVVPIGMSRAATNTWTLPAAGVADDLACEAYMNISATAHTASSPAMIKFLTRYETTEFLTLYDMSSIWVPCR